ncbi:MAG: bifunctional 5,10-methylenetetrahydrofolate dehydrogenase/5,10-methenyltetrahydrofolate cyclohydrolase [Candidatus Taylorbacteria bacterium]|nr:bifunctional 5,10-methylenetetrahydrofolate dehydrogenase/5,10-methenyltetrahydrofolate cyclohydrolase [Candidatus Taylorbacteria bacterium]
MVRFLDGKLVKAERQKALELAVAKLDFVPTLAIIQVGNRPDSNSYIEQKKKFGEDIGVKVEHIKFPEEVDEHEIISKIKLLNEDKSIQGIIVQIPMPVHIDRDLVIDAVDPKKDVDGLTATSLKYLFEGREGGFTPATTLGIISILKYYNIALEGKRVVLLGRSSLVGKPTMLALLNENSTVTICHSHTENLKEITQGADILIVAIGKPRFITHEYVSRGQIVIDVGINTIDHKLEGEVAGKKLVGDVDCAEVEDIVDAITPVPGGVGQMTVVSLFENLLKACKV